MYFRPLLHTCMAPPRRFGLRMKGFGSAYEDLTAYKRKCAAAKQELFFFSAFSVLTNNTDLEFGRLRAQLVSTTLVYIKLLLLSYLIPVGGRVGVFIYVCYTNVCKYV